MSKVEAGELAGELFTAFETGVPVAPLAARHGLAPDGAYAVQRELVKRHVAAGRRPVARKVGLTSPAMREQLGVGEPDYGLIFDTHSFASGASLSRGEHRMIAPRLEGELAFVLDRDLAGPGVDADQVLAATRWVVPVLELIDSRVADWKITLADTIADNASGWGLVAPEPAERVDGRDLAAVEMVLERDGDEVARGKGTAVDGHPARAVAWLANTLGGYGEHLPAGQLILSGSFSAAVDATPGRYAARFGDGLGSVEVEIVP